MRLAIITPCYNAGELLLEAVRSVRGEAEYLAALCPDTELRHIVIDDRSDDAQTVAYLVELRKGGKESGVVVIENCGRRGPAGARNYGIRHTAADWYGFLDADDRYVHGGLAILVARLRARPAAQWVAGELIKCWPDEQSQRPNPFAAHGSDENGWCIIDGLALQHEMAKPPRYFLGTSIIRATVFERHGGFDEQLLLGEDWTFALQLSLHTALDHTAAPVLYLRRGHDSLTSGSRALSFVSVKATALALRDPRFRLLRKQLRYTLSAQLFNLAARLREAGQPVKAGGWMLLALVVQPLPRRKLRRLRGWFDPSVFNQR
ncbi:MAG TPA: glycosyltransferase [Nitrococcus sp.]|nr:glycosyltransferase [Nitrococcus sp.]